MSQMKAYICVVQMQHEKTHEHRLVTDLCVAPSEEEALIKAALLAHPSGHDNWTVLSREAQELDREKLERAAAEVLGGSASMSGGATA